MSSPRVQKIYEAMPDQIRKVGKYKVTPRDTLRWQGRATDGKDAVVIDFTDSAWTGPGVNLRAIITAEPASDKQGLDALRTQSHASGHFIDGSVKFRVYMETPNARNDELDRFMDEIKHHLRGQLGAPLKVLLTANGTEPTVDGVNGAGATAPSATESEWLLPYGMVYPGGV